MAMRHGARQLIKQPVNLAFSFFMALILSYGGLRGIDWYFHEVTKAQTLSPAAWILLPFAGMFAVVFLFTFTQIIIARTTLHQYHVDVRSIPALILPAITWSALNLGVQLFIQDFGNRNNRRSTAFIADAGEFAWSVGTQYVAPLIASRSQGVLESARESANITQNNAALSLTYTFSTRFVNWGIFGIAAVIAFIYSTTGAALSLVFGVGAFLWILGVTITHAFRSTYSATTLIQTIPPIEDSS